MYIYKYTENNPLNVQMQGLKLAQTDKVIANTRRRSAGEKQNQRLT